MFVTGPNVVKTVTGENVTQEELGGASAHTVKSGVACLSFENDIHALARTRDLIDFLPSSNKEQPPFRPSPDPIDRNSASLDQMIPEVRCSLNCDLFSSSSSL
jgi:propionyl-CoA carboxylase beta chain